MRFLIQLFCISLIFFQIFLFKEIRGHPASAYTSKYDNIDVDAIFKSKRLLNNYMNCLLDKGACTNEGNELKKYLPEIIQTDCAKCNQNQKKIGGKVLGELLLNHKADYDKIVAKYDPDGTNQKKYFVDNKDYSDLEEA